jgi:ElaB/YqjD/DUF883 family membrane-anchored ribosome-binding protein
MTHSEFNHIFQSLGALSLEQIQQLRTELDRQLAAAAKHPTNAAQGSLGAMRDAADELDEIVENAMKNRENQPWRPSPGE